MRRYVENELQCYIGNIISRAPTPTTNSLILLTPTESRTIQFNPDATYPELLSDLTGLRGSHKTALTSDASCKYWVPGCLTHTSVQLGYKTG